MIGPKGSGYSCRESNVSTAKGAAKVSNSQKVTGNASNGPIKDRFDGVPVTVFVTPQSRG